MLRYAGIFILCLFTLTLFSTNAAAAPLPPLSKPAPLPPLPEGALLQSSEGNGDTETIQLSPVDDTFIANGPREIQEHVYGMDESLLVGQYNDLVTELRTLVGYQWTPPDNILNIEEASLFFGVGGGADKEMPVSIYYTGQEPINEEIANWSNRAWWGSGAPAKGKLGEAGYWYEFDVTEIMNRHVTWPYIGFSIRSDELVNAFYKISHSKESDPKLAPQLVFRYRYDDQPPEVWFDPMPEWATTEESFTVHGRERPDETTSFHFEVQYRLDGGDWQPYHISGNSAPYPRHPGKTIELRLRGVDRFGNTSDWVLSTPVKLYTYDLHGRIQDHRQRLLPPVDPHILPEPWWTKLSPEKNEFIARLGPRENLRATVREPEYGVWEELPLFRYHTPITITVPPPDNMMSATIMEDPRQWLTENKEDKILRSDQGYNGSIEFQTLKGKRTPALFCHRQFFTPIDLNQPTVGFHYWYSGYPANRPLELYWQDEAGLMHPLRKTFLDGEPGGWGNFNWHYVWADLMPFREQKGRLCISFESADGWHLYRVYLDRFILGSTPSELSLTLSSPPGPPAPGATIPLTLTVQNRSPYTATARLRLSIDAGDEDIITLPVLAPNATFSHAFSITMPQEGVKVVRAVAGKPEIDFTPADNVAGRAFILDPRWLYLPLTLH